MGLKEVLSKLKLVEVDAAGEPPAAPPHPAPGAGARPSPPSVAAPPPAPRSGRGATGGRDVADLLADLEPPPPIAAKGGAPAVGEGFSIPDFPDLYRAAGIPEPAHGFTALKVLEMLQSPDLAPLEPRAKAAAIAGFLRMNPGGAVPIADVLRDAVRRDQALDRFEQFVAAKVEERRQAIEKQNAALQSELDAVVARHQEQMEANRRELAAAQAHFAQWLERKRAEEARLAAAVEPFVDQNPITTTPAPPPMPGGARGRNQE